MKPTLRRWVVPLASIAVLFSLCLIPGGGSLEAAEKDKARWDRKYGTDKYIFGKRPIGFLVEHVDLLPKGQTLDIAMGEGRNGVYLATKGFDVTGIDISEKGLEKARRLAEDQGVTIKTKTVDLESYRLERNTYDLVLCTYYLQRDLFEQMKTAVKPGGMVVVETYTLDHRKYRPRFRKEWLLKDNELLEIFKDFKVIRYQNVDDGNMAYESIIAQRP